MTHTSKAFVAGALVCAAIIAQSLSASALERLPFDAAKFKAVQSAGDAVVIHVTAPWCPTCKAQHAAIDKLSDNAAFKDLVVLDVDFDSQAEVWRKLGATSQSTIIAYDGATESGRLVGVTKPDAIEVLFRSAMKQ